MNEVKKQKSKLVFSDLKRFWFLSILLGCLRPCLAAAQIIPDASLPNNSIVTLEGNLIRIEGGSQAGGNLFHSFSEFSVPTNTEAFFNNAVNIENILTRVTGNNISNIEGLIRANGAANLFLINPNGIILGNNARLAIGGSFFGTTAAGVQFADGLEYKAAGEPNGEAPLLSINVPIGLQLGQNSGAIEVRGAGVTDILPTDNLGLTVAPGQTFALVGNDINFSGGIVTAPSGRIEIGSVASGEVGIVRTPIGFGLNYENAREFANIRLGDRSSLFSPAAIDNPHSAINLAGRNIVLNGSQIVAVTDSNVPSGNITIRAAESLALAGTRATFPFSAWIVNQVAAGATGNSGNIDITAPQLSIQDGARIQTLSLGEGAAGNISVEAADDLRIAGFALPPRLDIDLSDVNNIDSGQLLEQSTHSRISSENLAAGAGGNLRVSAGEITFNGGGQISTLAGRQGLGRGGKVTVNAETINAEGILIFNPLVFSGIGSYTLGNTSGGNVEVLAQNATLLEGAEIFSVTQGRGKGGDISLDIPGSLVAVELNPQVPILPSGVGSFTFGAGDAGNIETSIGHLVISSGARLSSVAFIQIFGMSVPDAGTGNAGDVTVRADTIRIVGTSSLVTGSLSILNSSSFGSGDAGDVNVSARQIRILDGASIISGTAFSAAILGEPLPGAGTGNGGNVTVNASESIEVLGFNSFRNQNSSIATVSGGIGNAGNTRGIFGTEFRPRLTQNSDITASSQLGVDGTVEINTPDVDPTSGLLELAASPSDPSDKILSGCAADEGNEFYIIGRGGIPDDPLDILRRRAIWRDLRPVSLKKVPYNSQSQQPNNIESPIVEATGWVVNADGSIELVVLAPERTVQNPWYRPADCGNLNS